MERNIQEKIYAGVLGKIIGVYMGRPVEGWSYDSIKDRFGFIDYFVAQDTGAPLIVPDDDISGTFVFWRALEDAGYPADINAEEIGEAWLNYIIEDKTILWWGGLARSTEHSAYLRLKQGYKPPLSGSGKLNGMAIAEQIGSQIFIDTWAMVNPGNPARAARMAREAAIVSHDGIAIECAVYLAALEALAFVESDIPTLLRTCRQYIADDQYGKQLNRLLDAVIAKCNETDDWRVVRDWIETDHNYEKYQGNCPMVTNHLGVIMALIMGGDDFRKSIAIASSAGWDTDCNSGNIGCLNAIRLGLDSIDADADLRGPIADRMYVVSSDGGSVISNAVAEARSLIRAAAALEGDEVELPSERFAFDFTGSVQGFMVHPRGPLVSNGISSVERCELSDGVTGLAINYRGLSGSVTGGVAVQTYVDPTPKAAPDTSYFEVYASPTLYSGQTVTSVVYCEREDNPNIRYFIDYYNGQDQISSLEAEQVYVLKKGHNTLTWEIPSTGGRAVYKIGLELLSSKRKDGRVILETMDWANTPKQFSMGLSNELTPGISPFVIRTKWMMAFMNSTKHSGPDFRATLAISHPEDNGVMSIGSTDWTDYSVASRVQFVHANYAGLVARSKGHRRYYAAVFRDGCFQIIKRHKDTIQVLVSVRADYEEGGWYDLAFAVNEKKLSMYVDDKLVAECEDATFTRGGAGFVVSEGAIVAKRFEILGL